MIALFITFLIFNYLYRLLVVRIENNTIIDHIPFLYGYMIIMYIIRGSGFDGFFVVQEGIIRPGRLSLTTPRRRSNRNTGIPIALIMPIML